MNFIKRIHRALAAGTLGTALALPCSAQLNSVKPEDGSKHFAAVAQHLELGGLYYSYMDVDGDLAALASIGDRFIDLARRENKDIPKNLSAAKIIDALGLNSVKAIGMSTRRAGADLYHNRALIYMPDGPKGLMKITGGKPAPLHIASWAPADAGAAMQLELHLGTLLETLEQALKASGQEQFLAAYRIGLAMPVPAAGFNMNIGELIGKLNTRVMIVIRVDEAKKLPLAHASFTMPAIQIMVALDDVDFLMTPLLAALENNDNAVVEKEESATVIRMNSSLPGEFSYFKPAILHDKKAKRIILTSHLDMARSAGKGPVLASSEAYKKATAGLPLEGNGIAYVTPRCVQAIAGFYKEVLAETVKAGGTPPVVEDSIKLAWETLSVAPQSPVASVYANVPEGLLIASNTASTHKWTMVQAAIVPAFLGALGVGAYQGFQNVRARTAEAARPKKTEEDTEAPDKAVKNNLQQIVFSAHTWFIDHPGDKEVTYDTLVKNELIFELDPVAGESYKGLTLKRTGGEVSVKLKSGGSISHKYQAVTD